MSERIATTPFGGGRFGASDFQAQAWIEERRAELRPDGNDTGRADKWELLRSLTEARSTFGLGATTIRVLEVLLGFHQSKEIDGSGPIVVFPSNKELAARTRGMTERNIRRHLRALVQAALVLRHDSPNGKRYCTRDDTGQIDQAFGFDLAPLALKAAAIHEAAEKAREHLRTVRKVRGEITIHLRDINRIISTALEEDRSGDWDALHDRLRGLSGTVGRFTPLAEHERRQAALVDLRRDVENAYLSSMSEHELSANDGHYVRHIQNSKPESILISGKDRKKKAAGGEVNAQPWDDEAIAEAKAEPEENPVGSARTAPPVALGTFKLACSEFVSLSPDDIRSWSDVARSSEFLRGMLGISKDAMARAEAAMGPLEAAVTVACILQRHEVIRSPGGYLRALTARATDGKFSVRPMIDALIPK